METGATLEEDSFEYTGPLALAMPSTGGSDPDSGGDNTGHDSGNSSGGSDSGSSGGSDGSSFGGLSDADEDRGGMTPGGDPDTDAKESGRDSPDHGGMEGGSEGNALNTAKNVLDAVSKVAGIASLVGVPAASAIGIAAKAISTGISVSQAFASAFPDIDFSSVSGQMDAAAGSGGINGSEGNSNTNSSMPSANDAQYRSAAAAIANTMPTINDQFYSLFQGQNAPYNITDQMAGYTGVQDRAVSEWDAFEQKYNETGASIMDAYDTISSQYNDNIGNIPQVTLTLPKHMGGGTMPLAPGKWVNMYNSMADTQKDILDSKSRLMPTLADIQGSAITGRTQAGSNKYLTPMNTAFDIFSGDKNYANQQTSLDKQIEANEPTWYDRLAAMAPAVKPAIETGQELYDTISDALSGLLES